MVVVVAVAMTALSLGVAPTGADVNHDGAADLVAWNSNGVIGVKLANPAGSAFGGTELWANGAPFFGNVANLFGDVNGDGVQDLVAWNSNGVIGAKLANPAGSDFGPTKVYYQGEPFYGNVANIVADVNHDGAADLVAWNSNGVIGVKLANASTFTFGATQVWYSGEPFFGNVANIVTDVNHDGAADLVAWNSNGVIGVKLANPGGASFGATQLWYNGAPFVGNVANVFGDVNGDGVSDLVAWNSNGVINVHLADPGGSTFGPLRVYYQGEPFYGDVANLVADVNHDGAADLVAWNSNGVIGVKLANAATFTFGATQIWSNSAPFYGNIANVG